MIRSAPSCLAARTAIRPTAPSPTTATVLPGPAWAATAANQPVPSTSEAASSEGISSGVGLPRGGDEGAVGVRDAGLLGLGADRLGDELGVHALGLEPGLADLAGVVGDDERADDEVADLDVLDLGADLLDDADVLVPHRLVVGGLDAAVGPQVRPADAGRGQPDDRVGGLDDLRILALLHPDVAGRVHHYSTHRVFSLVVWLLVASRLAPDPGRWEDRSFQVLTGHPTGGAASLPSAVMDVRSEIRDFLTSRRGRIKPEDAGLKVVGPRRVPGLRREEVAKLAGLSVDYYNRLERGNLGGASDSVLDALADALRLDDAERAHLFDLALTSQPTSSRHRRSPTKTVRPSVNWILDAMTASPAFAENGRLDALGANALGRALFPAIFGRGRQPRNWARFVFFHPEARDFFADWDRAAKDCVAILRSEAGRSPNDRELSDLVGELATKSDEFRSLWAAHNVRLHTKGVKRLTTRSSASWSSASTGWSSWPTPA